MGGIEYDIPASVRGFHRRFQYNSTGFQTPAGIYIGAMPKGVVPLSIRFIMLTNFSTGGYLQMGFTQAESSAEWTGYIYVDNTTSNGSTPLIVSGSPKLVYEALNWADNITLPLSAERSMYLKGGTIGPALSAGDYILQVTYLDL